MSKKIAAASIVCLVFGGISIPGGIYVNNFIVDLTYNSMDDGLLGIQDEAIPLITPMVKEYGVAEALGKIEGIGGPAVEEIVKKIGPAMVLSIIREVGGPAVEEIVKKIGPAMVLSIIREVGGPAVEEIVKKIGPAMVLSIIREIGGPAVEDIVKKIGPAIVLNMIKDIGKPAVVDIIKQLGPAIALPLIYENAFPIVKEIVKSTFSAYMMDIIFKGLKLQTVASGYNIDVYATPASLNQFFNDQNYQFQIGGTVHTGNILVPTIGISILQFRGLSNFIDGTDYRPKAQNLLMYGQDELIEPTRSRVDGGGGGNPFDDFNTIKSSLATAPGVTVKKITLHTGTRIDGVGFTLSNGVDIWNGGRGGGKREFYLQPGEYIKKVQLKTGNEVDHIKFTTSLDNTFEHGGGGGGWREEIVAPEGQQIIGYYGRSGKVIDQLGFLFAPLYYELPIVAPGLILDSASGSGVTEFLKMYEAAESDESLQPTMQQLYDCDDWDQLTRVKNYIRDYLQEEMIPKIIDGVDVHVVHKPFVDEWHHVDLLPQLMPQLTGCTSVNEIADRIFAELWSEGTALGNVIYEGGLDFGEMIDGIPTGATGFEAGLNINRELRPLSLSTSDVFNLWDEDNAKAIANMEGIKIWYRANASSADADAARNTLLSEFTFLNPEKLGFLLDWLWAPGRFSDHLLPILLNTDIGYSMPIEDLAIQILYEQWANLKVLDMDLYPNGLNFKEIIEGIDEDLKGFEAGLKGDGTPDPLNLAVEKVENLWNENNPLALTNMDGILKWYEAHDDEDIREELRTEFGLDVVQINKILSWLWDEGRFAHGMLPKLIEIPAPIGYGVPIEDLAIQILYEQWSNATVLGMDMYDEGLDFSEMIGGIPENTTGFEAGLPSSLNLTLDQCKALWDESNQLALTNMDGIVKWFEANDDEDIRDELSTEFGLEIVQINKILSWLWDEGRFSDDTLPKLIQAPEPYGYGVPIEDLAIQILYEQWSNATVLGMDMYDEGLDFSEMIGGIPENTTGFEAGLPSSLNLTLEQCKTLWDESNQLALTNMDGIVKWFEANDDEDIRDELSTEFGLEIVQINKILSWLWDEGRFSDDTLPKLIQAPEPYGYGVPIEDIAIQILYEQWSNATVLGMDMYDEGLDFSEMIGGIPENTTGFEAGLPSSLNLTLNQCKVLWDESNQLALTNMDGIVKWFEANDDEDIRDELSTEFGLEIVQINKILSWLWDEGRFSDDTLPKLIQAPEPYGYGVPIEYLAIQILYEQWANGTVLGMDLYPDGINFNDLIGGFNGSVLGFEVCIENPTGLTLDQCKALWNSDNQMSFLNMMSGIPTWKDAKSNEVTRQALIDEYVLTLEQIKMLLDWLWLPGGFSDYLVPILIESDYGYGLPMDDFCVQLLLEQWANGTVFGEIMFPDPGFALPLGDNEIYGFEAGVPNPTKMSMDSALSLWNEDSDDSLVNNDGVGRWMEAVAGDVAMIEELKIVHGLDDHAMGILLDWIPRFQHDVMPYLAEYQYDLPMDTISLGNLLESVTTIIGGSCIGLAVLGLTSNVVVKKKRAKKVIIGDKISKHVFIKGMEEKMHDDPDFTKAPEELLNVNPLESGDNKEKLDSLDRNL